MVTLSRAWMRLGAAKSEAGRTFHFVQMQVPGEDQPVTREAFQFRVDKKKRQEAEWRDGHYLLRSNLTGEDPAVLWTHYLQLTLKHRLSLHAPGLTPAEVLEKLAEIQMIDVWIPTVDQRWLILTRHTQPSPDTKLLIEKLRLELPSQPPPRLVAQKESYGIEVQSVRQEARLW